MLHIYDKTGQYVASINKQDKLAMGYCPYEPWLLLHRTGRTDRFCAAKGSPRRSQEDLASLQVQPHLINNTRTSTRKNEE